MTGSPWRSSPASEDTPVGTSRARDALALDQSGRPRFFGLVEPFSMGHLRQPGAVARHPIDKVLHHASDREFPLLAFVDVSPDRWARSV
jgi:hypothetical protein